MAFEPGTHLGSYEIVDSLGAGGMGEVYRASDSRLGRDVALKVLPQALQKDSSRLARLDREARLLAALNHPNIAAIYDVQESGDCRFMVLELVPGETLAAILASGALSVDLALEYAGQIAGALEAAHNRGIVHRDLKPSNIMVTPEGGVKILDFGLAKGLHPEADPRASATISADGTTPGTLIGTFGYMSPEQARGHAIDHRTDIWAFGCVVFEMLSGRRTFPGATLSDRIAAVLAGDPDWEALPKETPAGVRDVLRRCLEKDLQARASSIAEVKAALARTVNGPGASAGRPASKRLRLASAAFAVLAAALAAAAIPWWLSTPQESLTALPESKILVVLPFKDLSGNPSGQFLGDGMVETLGARLAQVPDLQVVLPAAGIAAADGDREPFDAAGKTGASLMLQGSVQQFGDRVRIAFTVWNSRQRSRIAGRTVDGAASDLFALQDRVVEDVLDLLNVKHATEPGQWRGLETAEEQARFVQAIGRLQRYDREATVDEGIRELTTLAREAPDVPIVLAALARAHLIRFRLTRDAGSIEEANAACRRARQLNPELADVNTTLGELEIIHGRAAEAARLFQSVLVQQPNSYAALLGLADAESALGNGAEAEAACLRAIELQPAYWGGYSKLAGFYFTAANYPKAIEMFSKVTELSPDNARAYGNLGAAYQLSGDLDRALNAYNRSLALAPTPLTYSNVGTLHYFGGRFEPAVEAYEAALRLTPQNFQLWANLADACRWAHGRQSRAAQAYVKAIELCRNELRVNPGAGDVRSLLATALAKTGRVDEARKHIKQALAADPENPELLHDAAVVANIARKPVEALAWIALAIGKGYPKVFMERDPEFENLRAESAFKQAVHPTTGPRSQP